MPVLDNPKRHLTLWCSILEYKIAMDDGPDTEVLGRLAHLDIASAAAIAKYPNRNVYLCVT
jgi:hypothetical protein